VEMGVYDWITLRVRWKLVEFTYTWVFRRKIQVGQFGEIQISLRVPVLKQVGRIGEKGIKLEFNATIFDFELKV